MSVTFYASIIQIIVSVALIVLIMIQSKNIGLGSVFGGDSSIHQTRRGVEKTLHEATIGVSFVFFAVSILNVLVTS